MKHGIERAQVKMQKNDIRYVFYSYWNPGLASFTATAAGILKMNYQRFVLLSATAILLWNTFWGVLVYSLGESALVLLDFTVVIKIAIVWIIFELGMIVWNKYYKKVGTINK